MGRIPIRRRSTNGHRDRRTVTVRQAMRRATVVVRAWLVRGRVKMTKDRSVRGWLVLAACLEIVFGLGTACSKSAQDRGPDAFNALASILMPVLGKSEPGAAVETDPAKAAVACDRLASEPSTHPDVQLIARRFADVLRRVAADSEAQMLGAVESRRLAGAHSKMRHRLLAGENPADMEAERLELQADDEADARRGQELFAQHRAIGRDLHEALRALGEVAAGNGWRPPAELQRMIDESAAKLPEQADGS